MKTLMSLQPCTKCQAVCFHKKCMIVKGVKLCCNSSRLLIGYTILHFKKKTLSLRVLFFLPYEHQELLFLPTQYSFILSISYPVASLTFPWSFPRAVLVILWLCSSVGLCDYWCNSFSMRTNLDDMKEGNTLKGTSPSPRGFKKRGVSEYLWYTQRWTDGEFRL